MMDKLPSKRWKEMAEIYRRFGNDYDWADFSDEAMQDMYLWESYGIQLPGKKITNGFALGKKWMDVTIAMWKEDILQGNLYIHELLNDGYPEWFLKKIDIFYLRLVEPNWYYEKYLDK